MKRKEIRDIIRRMIATSMVFAMIFTTDMGVVFAQEEENIPAVAAVMDNGQTVEEPGMELATETAAPEETVAPEETTAPEEMVAPAETVNLEEADDSVVTEDPVEADVPSEAVDPAGEEDQSEDVQVAEEEETFTQDIANFCVKGHTPYKKVKKATLTTDGTVTRYCSVCGAKLSTETISHPESFKTPAKIYTYVGKFICPRVTVTSATGTIEPSNYKVTYENNKFVGTAKAKIVFQGSLYKGSTEVTFKIRPKATEITSLTPYLSAKGLRVKWNKVSEQVSGYQVQYATGAKFTSPTSIDVAGNSKFASNIKNLKAGKKYYVRVRAYRTVNSKKYYAAWSEVQSAKTYSNDEIDAWTMVKNVIKCGKALNYSEMNGYISGTTYIPFTTNEKIFYNIFKEENKNSYSYNLISINTSSANSIKVKIQVSSKNYSDAVAQGYLDMFADVQRSGNETEYNIYTCLKKYTLAAAEGRHKPFKGKYVAEINVIKKNGKWMVKSIPESIRNTFTCFAEVGLSYAENKLIEF